LIVMNRRRSGGEKMSKTQENTLTFNSNSHDDVQHLKIFIISSKSQIAFTTIVNQHKLLYYTPIRQYNNLIITNSIALLFTTLKADIIFIRCTKPVIHKTNITAAHSSFVNVLVALRYSKIKLQLKRKTSTIKRPAGYE